MDCTHLTQGQIFVAVMAGISMFFLLLVIIWAINEQMNEAQRRRNAEIERQWKDYWNKNSFAADPIGWLKPLLEKNRK